MTLDLTWPGGPRILPVLVVRSAAVAAPLAKMVSAAIPQRARTLASKTSKLACRRTTLRTPATTANPASAPSRAAARCLLRLRGLPIRPIRIAAM